MSKFIVTTYYSKDNTFYGSISDIIMEIFGYPIFESFDPFALVSLIKSIVNTSTRIKLLCSAFEIKNSMKIKLLCLAFGIKNSIKISKS